MAIWMKKESAAAAADTFFYVRSVGKGLVRIPKGYVPMVLVGDEEDGEERVLVHVGMLKEPRVLALLEMAAQQFGYGQRGVLRIPCSVQRFDQIVRDGGGRCKIMRANAAHTSWADGVHS